jgi:hypothetical protein
MRDLVYFYVFMESGLPSRFRHNHLERKEKEEGLERDGVRETSNPETNDPNRHSDDDNAHRRGIRSRLEVGIQRGRGSGGERSSPLYH